MKPPKITTKKTPNGLHIEGRWPDGKKFFFLATKQGFHESNVHGEDVGLAIDMDEARSVISDHLGAAELVKKYRLAEQACSNAQAQANKLNGELIVLRDKRDSAQNEMLRKIKVSTTYQGYDVRHNSDDSINIGCMKIPLTLAKKLIKVAPKSKKK